MNNRCLQAFAGHLLISVLLSAAALGADHGPVAAVRASAATAGANAAATVINPESHDCEELRLRTRSSIYVWGAMDPQARRPVRTRCVPVAGEAAARLVVVYRHTSGSTVTVTVDDGAISISPPAAGGRKARPSTTDVQVVDTLLSYD